MSEFIEIDRPTYSPEILDILESEIQDCREGLVPLKKKLEKLSDDLAPLQTRLVVIRRRVRSLEAKPKLDEEEVRDYLKQLDEIEASKVNGKFLGPEGNVPEGQEIVQDVLDECRKAADTALTK